MRARTKGNNEETTHNNKANTTDKSARETRERESLDDGERDMREVSEMDEVHWPNRRRLIFYMGDRIKESIYLKGRWAEERVPGVKWRTI